MQTKSLGIKAFGRLWSQVDFFIIVTNWATVINLVWEMDLKKIRIIECILLLMMWFKSLYFLRLVNEIAPLVESIFVIMDDIKYFMLIFIIGVVAFAQAFFVIGKN